MQLPIGYKHFNKNKFLNYQLNRWYSLGYVDLAVIEKIGKQIHSFSEYINEFKFASDVEYAKGNIKAATFYLRASEFLMPPSDERKITTYNQFIELFDRAFLSEQITRHKVPYESGYISTLLFTSKTSINKGTIVAIPGFDAFIEEFFCIWEYFAENGYDVIAFEGPGQGGTRRKYQLKFDHDFEKPTKAVLDYFNVTNATALGISMGGYWIMRAAAFEKRISKVIAMPPVYDWLEMTNVINQKLALWFNKHSSLTNFFVKMKMNVDTIRHTINNILFITGKSEPSEAVSWLLQMNKHHLCSNKIKQDVLLMIGENDAFQPITLLKKQQEALINAKSITTRIFTSNEFADQHCQIGNLSLALSTMKEWIEHEGS
jgi:pimeloyl-ACP methyl ester carboxylesterase